MFNLSPIKNTIAQLIFGTPWETDLNNVIELEKKDPRRESLLLREQQLKNQREAGTLKGEWERYTEERFWAELRYMFENSGFSRDAWRLRREYENLLLSRQQKQAANMRTQAATKRKARKDIEEAMRKQLFDQYKGTIDWPENPKYQGHNLKPELCEAELDYISCPPQNVPTLFEDKALKIKPFWLKGKSAAVASRNLKKGYGEKMIRYYYDLFDKCSKQKASTLSAK